MTTDVAKLLAIAALARAARVIVAELYPRLPAGATLECVLAADKRLELVVEALQFEAETLERWGE